MRFVTLKSRIPALIAQAEVRGAAAVHKTAFDIEAGAKSRSRVDTGRMKGGWTTEISGPFEAEVSNNVEYTVYNEFGTEGTTPQPMLGPSVEIARPLFLRAMGQLYR